MGIGAGSAEICPHCQVNVRFEKVVFLAKDGTKLGPMGVLSIRALSDFVLSIVACSCPHCGRPILAALNLN